MSAAEEYARQAKLAAEESKASAARSAAHAQAFSKQPSSAKPKPTCSASRQFSAAA